MVWGSSKGQWDGGLSSKGNQVGLMLRPQSSLMSGVAGECVATLGPFFSNL